ncbi:hypothetical protein [Magnetospira sp. QH-2]|uniref:hypothetical protein n=1 Tax=Magnetospira sp. (strain QH-2) TaxID=1288970 RepID=UPI0011DCE67F|nr:hypothetical protein [Magnetospira sp. QH-2]
MAQKVILADGRVEESEKQLLNRRIAEMGGDIRSPAEEVYGDSNTEIFEDRSAQIIALMELYALVYADSDGDPQELAMLGPLVRDWGIEESACREIETWAALRSDDLAVGEALLESLSQ